MASIWRTDRASIGLELLLLAGSGKNGDQGKREEESLVISVCLEMIFLKYLVLSFHSKFPGGRMREAIRRKKQRVFKDFFVSCSLTTTHNSFVKTKEITALSNWLIIWRINHAQTLCNDLSRGIRPTIFQYSASLQGKGGGEGRLVMLWLSPLSLLLPFVMCQRSKEGSIRRDSRQANEFHLLLSILSLQNPV